MISDLFVDFIFIRMKKRRNYWKLKVNSRDKKSYHQIKLPQSFNTENSFFYLSFQPEKENNRIYDQLERGKKLLNKDTWVIIRGSHFSAPPSSSSLSAFRTVLADRTASSVNASTLPSILAVTY